MSPIVKLQNGTLRDEIRQPIYDTVEIAAAVSPIGSNDFFSNVQAKNRWQTNLRQNNMLDTANSFRVQGIAMDAMNQYSANEQVIPTIMHYSSARFRVGEKDYWDGPMRFLAGRIDSAYATSAAEYVHQKFGAPAVQPVIFEGRHVIDIAPLQSFRVTWTCEDMTAAEIALATAAADTSTLMMCSLKGLLRRPVQ